MSDINNTLNNSSVNNQNIMPEVTPQGARPQRAPQGTRPQGARPQGAPQGTRPQGAPQGTRPQGAPQGARPQGGPQGTRPQGAPQGSRPQRAPQGTRPQGAPQGTRPQGAPQGTRPQGAPQGTRPQGAPQGSRPQRAPQGTRPQGAPQGARPSGGMSNGSRNNVKNPNKKSKLNIFRVAYTIFIAVMLIFWIFIIVGVRGNLKEYEAAQPEKVVSRITKQIEAGDIEGLVTFNSSSSKFEDPNLSRNAFISAIEGKNLTYEKDPNSYDALSPVYNIIADDEIVATVKLAEESSYKLMFILSAQKWKIEEVVAVSEVGNISIDISVPTGYRVTINGIETDATDTKGEAAVPEEFEYSSAYVEVPSFVQYEITGLTNEPDVKIYDASGAEVTYEKGSDGSIMVTSFPAGEMTEELESYVIDNAETYSNFFSADLGSDTSAISYMLTPDSYYLELATTYAAQDMWMYSPHNTPEFLNVSVNNYIVYSDNFFSCEVYFDKRMILTRTGEERIDTNHTRYYYVKINDEWLIADMQTVIDENAE